MPNHVPCFVIELHAVKRPDSGYPRAGFGLIEVMVASVVVSIVFLGTSALIQVSSRFQRTVQEKTEFRNLSDQIDLMVDNPSLCERALISAERNLDHTPKIAVFDPDATNPDLTSRPTAIRVGDTLIAKVQEGKTGGVTEISLTEADRNQRQINGTHTTYLARLTVSGASSARSLTHLALKTSNLIYVQTEKQSKRITCCSRQKESCESISNRRFRLCTIPAVVDGYGNAYSSASPSCSGPAGSSIVAALPTAQNGAVYGSVTLYEYAESGRGAARDYRLTQIAGDPSLCPSTAPSGYRHSSGGCVWYGVYGCATSVCLHEKESAEATKPFSITQAGDAPGCPSNINCASVAPSGFSTLVDRRPYATCGNGASVGELCLWSK